MSEIGLPYLGIKKSEFSTFMFIHVTMFSKQGLVLFVILDWTHCSSPQERIGRVVTLGEVRVCCSAAQAQIPFRAGIGPMLLMPSEVSPEKEI